MHNLIDVEKAFLREDRPEMRPGDTVRVHVRITETPGKERIQVFEGVLLRQNHRGLGSTFTVRKVSFGIGVERIFPLHSPQVAKVEVIKSAHVRRSRLYYLRQRKGKAARLKPRRRHLNSKR